MEDGRKEAQKSKKMKISAGLVFATSALFCG
jgi:hypothetical protein